MINYYIGIDVGKYTGIALWNVKKQRLEEFKTVSFWECIDYIILTVAEKKGLRILVEDPNLNKPIFIKKSVAGYQSYLKIAQNVGMNKRDAQLILEFCTINLIDAVGIKPVTTKWTAAMFIQITGIEKRTSQHVRDAVKLVYGLRD